MPALAQTQPLRVSTISTPRFGAQHPRCLSPGSARPAAGPCRGARRALSRARRASLSSRSRTRPSAFETDLLRDGDDVARRRARHPRARPRSAISSPRPVAGLDLGQALDRRSSRRRAAHPRAPPASRPVRSSCRGRRRGAVGVARRARRPSAARSSGVSTSRASDSSRSTATVVPGPLARSRVAGAAAGAERRADRVRRAPAASALVPVPWRSGTTATRSACASAPSAASSSAGVEQRAVPGQQCDARRRRAPSPGRSPAWPPRNGPGRRGRAGPRSAWRRAARGVARPARLGPRR